MPEAQKMREIMRLEVSMPVLPYLKDHNFAGKVMLPAVETLQWLASSSQACRPDLPVRCMHGASFDRFLTVATGAETVEAIHELEFYKDGRRRARLLTKSIIGGSSITRTKIHAVVCFLQASDAARDAPGAISCHNGTEYTLSPDKLYAELVPLGSAYRNVQSDVCLSARGATAKVFAARHATLPSPLGSPFPLDAALHVACAWGQRFHGVTAFPVGFKRRLIEKPTLPGETYFCRIEPVVATRGSLCFDIRIHDAAGFLCEEIDAVLMKDVFGGRLAPPDWILSKTTG